MNYTELGGFAERPSDIDGNEEELNAFNFCLAEEYFGAMINEDWDSLGEMSTELFQKIEYWLNYNGEIGKDDEETIAQIPTGLIMTQKNRTFADAVISEKKGDIAEILVYNGNHDVKLYFTAIAHGNSVSIGILNYIHQAPIYHRVDNPVEAYVDFIDNIFALIEHEYEKYDNALDKQTFLKAVMPHVKAIRFPDPYVQSMQKAKEKMLTLKWYNDSIKAK